MAIHDEHGNLLHCVVCGGVATNGGTMYPNGMELGPAIPDWRCDKHPAYTMTYHPVSEYTNEGGHID